MDNAFHFIGDNIDAAGRELGFDRLRFQPGSPWLKGSLERFFGTLNSGLVHSLPGTTLHNVVVRKGNENLGPPTLTLTTFEAMFVKWVCDVYHVGFTKGLGRIRGIGDSPLAAWNDMRPRVKSRKI